MTDIEKIEIKTNEFTPIIKSIYQSQMVELDFHGLNAIPSLFIFVFFSAVLLFICALWPYGFLEVISDYFGKLLLLNVKKMQDQSVYERAATTIVIGIYFIIWLPFFVACLPLLFCGWVGVAIQEVILPKTKK